MTMLIAWQTVNAVRHPQTSRFTWGLLIVTPGITIRDRLRVLQPNDPDSYVYNTERRLLYVACTRARDHLLITKLDPASEFLSDLNP